MTFSLGLPVIEVAFLEFVDCFPHCSAEINSPRALKVSTLIKLFKLGKKNNCSFRILSTFP